MKRYLRNSLNQSMSCYIISCKNIFENVYEIFLHVYETLLSFLNYFNSEKICALHFLFSGKTFVKNICLLYLFIIFSNLYVFFLF